MKSVKDLEVKITRLENIIKHLEAEIDDLIEYKHAVHIITYGEMPHDV